MPVLFPLTEVLFRLPLVGRVFSFIIPVANYVNEPDLSLRQRYRWAVLDTFDMLSPAFDFPQTETDVRSALGSAGVGEISRRTDTGLNLIGIKMP
jgi:hypothetical protein